MGKTEAEFLWDISYLIGIFAYFKKRNKSYYRETGPDWSCSPQPSMQIV